MDTAPIGIKQRILSLLLFTFCSIPLTAQQFYFPAANYADSATLAQSLPGLAQQMRDSLAILGGELPVRSKMNLALAAGAYQETLSYLDSIRLPFNEDFRNGIFIPFEVYARARQQQKANVAFSEAIETQFKEVFTALNVPSQAIVEANASVSLGDLRKSLDAMVSQHKASDTLELSSALQLIRVYTLHTVYSQTVLMMRNLIETHNRNTYEIETKAIEVRDGSRLRAHVVRKKGMTKKLPTVFIFNIYADSLRDIGKAKFYASEGYACVVANTRGKGLDMHEINPFEDDGQDAYDLIDWISQQE
jgi:uncharacterized protein